MLKVANEHGFVRRCWRRFGRRVPMVVWPQEVPYYGFHNHGDMGVAQCTGCGKTHLILGWFRGLLW